MSTLDLQADVHELWDTLVKSQFEESEWVGERLAALFGAHLLIAADAFAWGFDHDCGLVAPVEASVCDGFADQEAARTFANATNMLNGGKYQTEPMGRGVEFLFGRRIGGVRVVFSFTVFNRADVPSAQQFLTAAVATHRAT
ncbi:hypothetical protein [Glycomyces sp. YM15]|uniref:hypothetical protein n=1 Tax=Glycomyces sp. YM15 TaxID=2800446 RepID=UPI001963ED95|nr:hypothetical protein [Glycomyces sp. YM15]